VSNPKFPRICGVKHVDAFDDHSRRIYEYMYALTLLIEDESGWDCNQMQKLLDDTRDLLVAMQSGVQGGRLIIVNGAIERYNRYVIYYKSN
jgi:hypothetical protein